MSTGVTERLFLRTGSRQVTWPPPDAGRSSFQEADPAPALRDQVEKIRWGHEWIPPESPVRERILPDGALHLLFVISDAGPGPHGVLVLGATRAPTIVQLAGRIEHVEVELRPGAATALLGVPAGELTGQAIELQDLWGDRAAIVRDRLVGTRDPAERLRIVQDTLASALRPERSQAPAVLGEALRRISAADGSLRVRELAADLGLTERRVEQLFHQHVGISPKATCRLARLRGGVELLARSSSRGGPRSWAEIALDLGFSDQSHLVNEFRALTGLSPGELQRRSGLGRPIDGD